MGADEAAAKAEDLAALLGRSNTQAMKRTAVQWLENELQEYFFHGNGTLEAIWKQAKEMEKEQMGYTKKDVLKAGEMGEINHHDTKHILSYLDEAKQYNETFNTNEK
jgi:hypothetical protein